MSMAIVAGVAVAAVSVGTGIYSAVQQGNIAGQQLALAGDVNSRQAYSFNQLQQLFNDPSSFFNSPVYQAAFGQGTKAVGRSAAASGFLNSGNAASELQAYGQSFGQQQLLQQESLLASLSGANVGTSAGSALAGASASNSAQFNQLGGLLAGLGYSMNSGVGWGAPTEFQSGAVVDAGSAGMATEYAGALA